MGLSGGVDSAVSAALLQQQGHEVTGVFIRIALPGYPCSAGEDKISAQRVAAHLEIPFIEIDLSKEYQDEVFAYTLSELAKGRTPNPDTLCNQKIKFGAFYDYARSHGADAVATGHYARIAPAEIVSQKSSGRLSSQSEAVGFQTFAQQHLPVQLLMGADSEKDQSYFLWMVPQEILQHVVFPIGNMRKTEVRELAAKFELPNAARPDSQGLCFLGDTSIDEMIKRELGTLPGDVLNEQGTVVGRHDGVALYTLGQRHGFLLFTHTQETQPHFVIAKNNTANTITVSTARFPRAYTNTTVALINTNWIAYVPNAIEDATLMARFRYRQKLIPAKLALQNGSAEATLLEPHYVPLGQSLVFYKGKQCIGGGIVEGATLC